MSLKAYQDHGICVTSDDSNPTLEGGELDNVVQFKHKGFKDVTVIRKSTAYGMEEEMIPTSAYLPPAPKNNERALRKFDRFSVIVRRIIQRRGDREMLLRTELCIQSRTLCEIFRSIVIDTHASFDINSTPIVMPAPFYELFFRRNAIKAYVNDIGNEENRAEVKLLHDFFLSDKLTMENIPEYESMISQGKINDNTLWTLFPPNELLFLNTGGAPECWLCRDVRRQPETPAHPAQWLIDGVQIGFNGHKLGLTIRTCPISFAGRVDLSMEISELPLVPKPYFDRADTVTNDIVKRGKIFQSIMGDNLDGHAFRHHQGVVWSDNEVDPTAKGVVSFFGL
jgi:hypothetical protein